MPDLFNYLYIAANLVTAVLHTRNLVICSILATLADIVNCIPSFQDVQHPPRSIVVFTVGLSRSI